MTMRNTALITGASAGLGATYARHLAAQGFDLILVARRLERLEALAAKLRQQYLIQVEPLSADLSNPNDLERLEKYISQCDTLSMLVNNAGFGIPGNFSDVDIHKTLNMIDVMVIACVRLARAALPGMITRKCGAIINISSIAAFTAAQGNPTYAATKAYLNAFSEALAFELRGTGVKVQAVCPGFTITEFHDAGEYEGTNTRSTVPKWLWVTADQVVTQSLKDLIRGKLYSIYGTKYRLAAVLGRLGFASLLGNNFVRRFRKANPTK
jgi:uncharacterized protein